LPLQPFSRIKQIRRRPHPQAVAEFPRNMESCPAPGSEQTSKPVSTSFSALSTRDRMYEYAVPSQD
jgi:hypothetical protein